MEVVWVEAIGEKDVPTNPPNEAVTVRLLEVYETVLDVPVVVIRLVLDCVLVLMPLTVVVPKGKPSEPETVKDVCVEELLNVTVCERLEVRARIRLIVSSLNTLVLVPVGLTIVVAVVPVTVLALVAVILLFPPTVIWVLGSLLLKPPPNWVCPSLFVVPTLPLVTITPV